MTKLMHLWLAAISAISMSTFGALYNAQFWSIATAVVAFGAFYIAGRGIRLPGWQRSFIVFAGALGLWLLATGVGIIAAYLLANANIINLDSLKTDALFYRAFLYGPLLILPALLLSTAAIRALRAAPR